MLFKHAMLFKTLAWLCTFFIMVSGIIGAAQTIKISGSVSFITHSIEMTNGVRTNLVMRVQKRRFLCESSDCFWRISTREIVEPNSATNWPANYEIAGDGTNTYWLRTSPSNIFAATLLRNPTARIIRNQGTVRKGAIPVLSAASFHTESQVAPIWFAYCSSCYLNSLKGRQIGPLWIVHEREAGDTRFHPTVELERA